MSCLSCHLVVLSATLIYPKKPAEPESEEPEVESLIDISNGLDSLDVTEFHQHSQVEQLQMQLAQVRLELEETQQEKALEVTKLLEHISKMEHEKESLQQIATGSSGLQSQIDAALATQKAAETKSLNLESAYKQLKDKHLALVTNHANLIRSSASDKDKLSQEVGNKLIRLETEFEEYKAAQLNCAIEGAIKTIQLKKDTIGSEDMHSRIQNLSDVSIASEKSPNMALTVAQLSAQMADLAGDAAQKDGNLIPQSSKILTDLESALNQLLVQRDHFNLEAVRSSMSALHRYETTEEIFYQ